MGCLTHSYHPQTRQTMLGELWLITHDYSPLICIYIYIYIRIERDPIRTYSYHLSSLVILCSTPSKKKAFAACKRACFAAAPPLGPLLDHFRPQERLPKSLARRDDRAGSALTWSPKEWDIVRGDEGGHAIDICWTNSLIKELEDVWKIVVAWQVLCTNV